jgi:DNA polymerase-4
MPEPSERTILHVDANCFFVSCHVARDPARLAGRPAAVAGDPERRAGVVLSASYEARRLGVHGAMPLGEALRLCPHLVVIPPDFGLYRERSGRMHALFREFSPLVEPFSIDEAWIDLTGCGGLGPAGVVARAIQRRLQAELALPASIGIGPNKLLAKMASGLRKPRGITELSRADVPLLLWPLPVADLFGVGPALAARLAAWNVRSIGDLARLGPAFLERRLGQTGRQLWVAAHGRDDAAVDPAVGEAPKSVGCSVTLGRDVWTCSDARPVLLDLSEKVARRLRARRLVATTVTVTLRDSTFRDRSRSASLADPTDSGADLLRCALGLAAPALDGSTGYRLLGVTATRLGDADRAVRQPTLFDGAMPLAAEHRRAAERAADAVRDRFGDGAIVPALLLPPPRRPAHPRRAG